MVHAGSQDCISQQLSNSHQRSVCSEVAVSILWHMPFIRNMVDKLSQCRINITFLMKLKKTATDILKNLQKTYGEETICRTYISPQAKWLQKCKGRC
jgi:Mg2+ and Co2+ transporter CorA